MGVVLSPEGGLGIMVLKEYFYFSTSVKSTLHTLIPLLLLPPPTKLSPSPTPSKTLPSFHLLQTPLPPPNDLNRRRYHHKPREQIPVHKERQKF